MSFGGATAIALQAIRLRGCAIGVANTRNLPRLCARFTARIRRVSRAMCSFHCAHTPAFFCSRESAFFVAMDVSMDRKIQVVVIYAIE